VLFFNRVLVFGPKCKLLFCPKEVPDTLQSGHRSDREEEVKDNVMAGENDINRDLMGKKYGTFN